LYQTLDSMSAAMTNALTRQLKAARKHYDILRSSAALQSPVGYLDQRRKSLDMIKNRMISAQNTGINRKKQRYIALVSKLDAMSPLKVLTRGYAMAQKEDGQVIRSVQQVQSNETISVMLSDGSFDAAVIQVKENGK